MKEILLRAEKGKGIGIESDIGIGIGIEIEIEAGIGIRNKNAIVMSGIEIGIEVKGGSMVVKDWMIVIAIVVETETMIGMHVYLVYELLYIILLAILGMKP